MKKIEIKEKRTKNEKHFLKEDGNIELRMYKENIHYLKDGKYEEINNELKENESTIENKENEYKVLFSKNNGSVKYIKDNFYLSINIKNINEVNCFIEKNSKYNSKVVYKNLLNNVDIEYIISSSKVKENILINNNIDFNTIEYEIDTNLDLEVKDNTLVACNDGKDIFRFDKPYLCDYIGNESFDVYYGLIGNKGKYLLKLSFDKNWLDSKERSFPVIIDPTFINSCSEIDDTYIYEGDTNDVRYNRDYIIAGVQRIGDKDRVNRSLLKFKLPSLGTSDEIIKAELVLYGYMATDIERPMTEEEKIDNTPKIVSIHEITKDWTLSGANWENMNDSYNKDIEAVAYVFRSYFNESLEPIMVTSMNTCLITNLVKRWYQGSPNYGIMLKQPKEEYINTMAPSFFSSNYGDGSITPLLIIEYRRQNGIKPYMDMKIQSFTNGNSYLNTFNGNLTTIFNLSSTVGIFPASLSLVYNTNDVVMNKNSIYGKGYRLSLDQVLKKIKINNEEKLEYTDSSGGIHYFNKNENIYIDEDGLNLKVELSNNEATLTDKTGNKMLFSKNGDCYYLSKIEDISTKEINIIRNDNNNIVKVLDANSNEIKITYENDKIIFASPSKTTTLNYKDGNLSTINTLDGNTNFVYNSNNIITEIIDVTGLSIHYIYYSNSPYKLKKIIQYGKNLEEGASLNIEYGLLNTKIIDNKGRVTTNVYNYYGNLLSSNSMDENGNLKEAYSISSTYGNEFENPNKLLSSTIPIKFSKNYAKITDLYNMRSNTVFSSCMDIGSYQDFSLVSSVELYSTEVNQYSLTGFTLPKGKTYTWSGYFKTNGKSNIKFYTTSSNTLFEKDISANGDFEKVYFTFTKNDDTDLFMKIYHKEPCSTYIGDIQIEEGNVVNDYNIVENSDFSYGYNDWSFTANEIDTGKEVNIENVFEIAKIDDFGNKALKVNMNPYNRSQITKEININGTKDDLYYLSFWYKNEGVETDIAPNIGFDPTGSIISNSVSLFFKPIEGEIEYCIPTFELNSNKDVWQYYSIVFSPEKDFNKISINFNQGRETGNLYITNVSLYKGLKTNKYKYDDHGNIIEINNTNESSIFDYDKNNELIKATNPRGRNFKVEYDNIYTDRILSTSSSSGISNKIKYDNFGNPVQTTISKTYNETLENGLYKIRVKGTNKYLKIENNTVTLKEDLCSNTIFEILRQEDKYQIKYSVNNKYLQELNNVLTSSDIGSLFKLEENKNGSYHIYIESIENENNRKYLKVKDNNSFEFIKDPNDILDNYLYEFYFENVSKLFIENDATYSSDGRFLTSVTDSLLNKTTYEKNQINGLTTKKINANNIETEYMYNDKEQLTKIKQGNKEVNYTYNNQNLLSEIIQGNKKYEISYNNFLNTNDIKLNNKTLITNSYEKNNGNLLKSTYGNNDVISYEYDSFDRVKKVIKENNVYEYIYDNNGNIFKVIDSLGDEVFDYDKEKRLINYLNNNYSVRYCYDRDNNIIKKKYKIDDASHNIDNIFNKEGNILESNYDNINIKYSYDELLRLVNKKINDNYEVKYEYVSIGNRTSALIKSITNGNEKYYYKYDKLYNITDIYHNNELISHYDYDEYNELLSEKDYINKYLIEYNYDNEGNILSKIKKNLETNVIMKTDTYEYCDSTWEDLLTKYNDESITYDEIGNPLTIGNKVLTWINGRQLDSYTDDSLSVKYKYNMNGIRTEKIVNGVKTEYYLEGNNIVYEKTDNNIIYYLYDITGVTGLNYNNVIYYFVKNLQGDIIGITNSNNELIVKYEYDSFGNVIDIKDSNNQSIKDQTNIGLINPLRYRGYYYDKETELYYLNSRYYNPKWGRFLNADGIIGANDDILSNNLFIYVSNNFIKYVDVLGTNFFSSAAKMVKEFIKSLIDKTTNAIKEAIKQRPNGTTIPYRYNDWNVYIVKTNQEEEYKKKMTDNDVLIIDNREQENPEFKVIDSYGIWCNYNEEAIIDIIFEYNESYPSKNKWRRTKKSMIREWNVHSLLYFLGYERERTRDVNFDNADENSVRFNNIFWDIFYM